MLATLNNASRKFLSQVFLQTRPKAGRRNQHSKADASVPQPSGPRYTICDNQGSTARARRILASAPYVLFDCEGHNSKCRDGSESLSLVQMGTPHAEDIFVFDMLALKNSNRATRSVLSLLNSPKILKVGWGGVQDYMTLWRIYKTPMQSFLDLQIVDIHSRIRRRESREVQISRLASDHFPASAIEKLQIDGVHALSTMDKALAEHSIISAPRKENHKGRWAERPLSASDIRYAVNDIARISELHNHFKISGTLMAKSLTDGIAQTTVYLELFGPSGTLNLRRRFVPSNVLPLGILGVSIDDPSFFTKNRDLRRCKCCHRPLSLDCFPAYDVAKGTENTSKDDAYDGLLVCKVCTFAMKRDQYFIQRTVKKAAKYLKDMRLLTT